MEQQKKNGWGTPIQPAAGTELLNLGDRSSGSNHRLVRREYLMKPRNSFVRVSCSDFPKNTTPFLTFAEIVNFVSEKRLSQNVLTTGEHEKSRILLR